MFCISSIIFTHDDLMMGLDHKTEIRVRCSQRKQLSAMS